MNTAHATSSWTSTTRAARPGSSSVTATPVHPRAFDAVLVDAGLQVIKTGIRIPRMNSIMQRWIQTCRRDCSTEPLIYNQRHLLHAKPLPCAHCPNRSPIRRPTVQPVASQMGSHKSFPFTRPPRRR